MSYRITPAICASALSALTLLCSPGLAQEPEGLEPFAFDVRILNEGLPAADPPLRVDTPRAALESFIEAVQRDELARAAHALNLNGIPAEEQASRAPDLALMLAFLLHRYNLIDWSEVPDQPDARVVPRLQQAVNPYRRRSVELGDVQLDGRPVPISLQRFRAEDGEPVWLFAPFAVERIPQMYAESRPGILSNWVPLRDRLETMGKPSLAEWLAALTLLVFACLLWLALYFLTRTVARRLPIRGARTARKLAVPLATAAAALAFRFGTDHLFLFTGPATSNLGIGSEVIALIAGAWLLFQVLSAATLALSERYVVPLTPEDPENRRTKTTVYVVRRVALVVIALLSVAYILLKIDIFASFGLSVLASAGALGVIVAIAARPLLSNMVAGLEIALTDPVRVGDVVVYGEHWATVEDISFAHTILRTWTDTRLIVPHADLLTRPFENWSKEGEAVRRIVKVPVDYRIDVEQIRRKVQEIVEGDPRSTGEPPMVEMAEVNAETAIIWIWISGTTAFTSWYLHNEVREALMVYLRELDDGRYLPRRRYVLLDESKGSAERGAQPESKRRSSPPHQ